MTQALNVLALCRTFHCLPSQLYAEDAGLLQMLEIERRLHPDGE